MSDIPSEIINLLKDIPPKCTLHLCEENNYLQCDYCSTGGLSAVIDSTDSEIPVTGHHPKCLYKRARDLIRKYGPKEKDNLA